MCSRAAYIHFAVTAPPLQRRQLLNVNCFGCYSYSTVVFTAAVTATILSSNSLTVATFMLSLQSLLPPTAASVLQLRLLALLHRAVGVPVSPLFSSGAR